MNDPLVSVITPTYNRAYIIKNAIDSVMNQTYPNWELIVIDDGSTDNTKEVVESYQDQRIRYYKQNNQGPAKARNRAGRLAKGKWIAYIDSDNELLPNYLDTMVKWLKDHPKAIFAFPRAHRTLELYENGKLVKEIDGSNDTPTSLTIHDIFMKNLHVETNGFMHLKTIFDEGIAWDGNLHGMEDWEFAMQIGEKHPDGFLYVPVVLYRYHQRYGTDGLVSNSTYEDWAVTFEKIYQKHKNDKMLKGQQWYPQRVKKWSNLQKEYEAGKRPPYYLHYFQDSQTP